MQSIKAIRCTFCNKLLAKGASVDVNLTTQSLRPSSTKRTSKNAVLYTKVCPRPLGRRRMAICRLILRSW